MADFYLFVIEGVLADLMEDTDSLGAAPSIPHGRAFYTAAKAVGSVGLVTAQTDREMVEEWLQREGFAGYNDLVTPNQAPVDPATWRANTIPTIRRRGWHVTVYVDADPTGSARALHHGCTTLTVTHPAYARPEWRPDSARQVRSWDSLVGEARTQRELRAHDHRVPEGT